jgi:hypothetical protein
VAADDPDRTPRPNCELPDWTHLGEFYIGIGRGDRIRFTVLRSHAHPTLHRLTADEMTPAGPRLIAILTNPPTKTEKWCPDRQKTQCAQQANPNPARSSSAEISIVRSRHRLLG